MNDTATPQSLAPSKLDYTLGVLALAILAAALIALFRGMDEWHQLPPRLWFHIVTVTVATALTPIMLWRRRGDKSHRVLGYIWVFCMVSTALVSFTLRFINPGGFSPIHLLSILTLVVSWKLVAKARAHKPIEHRREVRGIVTGALLIAGFFTFPFNRLMGTWLQGMTVFN
ncbi:DUF2306 domain-containing protein [Altererythrobacter sp. ZODW24]|uniref:DUF2306 domain-containing protein n=1 Tax=Altererythrobacter sp. ZODW24 TaxID=2185142 RepID=UPI000DF7339A|nr:DUF2306 domain-containing protein [Altererythrobacter sp. ZODW24]